MFHDNLFVNRTVDCERWHLSDANKFIQDLQIRENQQMYSVCCDLYYSHCKEMGVGICYRKVFPLKEQLKYDVFERIEHAYIISCILQYA